MMLADLVGYILLALMLGILVGLLGMLVYLGCEVAGWPAPFERLIRRLFYPRVPRFVVDNEFVVTFCRNCGKRLLVEIEVSREEYDETTGKLKQREADYYVHCKHCPGWLSNSSTERFPMRKSKEG
jgi:hypothetical protein